MGFETLHENQPFFKKNRVAVPGRTVSFQPNDKLLPEPQLQNDELPQFSQEMILTGGDYSNPITYYWNVPTGTTLIGYYLDTEIDASIFFSSLVPGQTARWVDPVTQQVREYFYTSFFGGKWINEIGNVKPGQAYIMIMTTPATIARAGIIGDPVSHNLNPTNNLLTYMGDTPIDALVAFQDVIDAGALVYVRWIDPDTLVAKDLYYSGIPAIGWINNIGNLIRGQGYIVRVSAPYNNFVL